MHSKWSAILLLGVCALHLVLAFGSARLETPTVDEFAHVPAGLAYWREARFDLYSKNPPLGKLWLTWPLALSSSIAVPRPTNVDFGWSPWVYGAQFEKANESQYFELFTVARVMNILLSLATGFLIFYRARAAGENAGLLATAGFLLSPTVLAHAHLATVDIASAFTIGLVVLLLDLFKNKISLRKACGLGSLFGLALATKFTACFLLPWILFSLPRRSAKPLRATGLSILATFMVVNLAYGFTGVLNGLPPLSARLPQFFLGWLPADLPLPLPRDFIAGFDAQAFDAQTGEFGSYLFGEWSQTGWWYYNLIAFFLKENLVTIAGALALVFALPRLLQNPRIFQIFVPLLLVGLPLSLLSHLQIGIRYLLPIYPLLFVLLAEAWGPIARSKVITGLLVALLALPAVTGYPNYLASFNGVARALGEPQDLLLDSNFDWGQDLYRLRGLNAEAGGPIGLLYFGHVMPSLYGIEAKLVPARPAKGVFAVSANFLKGYPYVTPLPDGSFVQVRPETAGWLKALKPVRQEGSIFIFDTR